MKRNSEILSETLSILYPFIIIFGIYIILNGHITPGGGFQGGAILSSVFICRYIVSPEENLKMYRMQVIEKLIFLLIILVFTLFLVFMLNQTFPQMNTAFLMASNILIGLKVCCGLSLIFFRFVFYESR